MNRPRKPTALVVGREPLPEVVAFLASRGPQLGPGLHQVVVMHDHDCRYPAGGVCTCRRGPEIQIPAMN